MFGLASNVAESTVKYGAEVASASDPLAAAIALGGKIGVGASLSRFSARDAIKLKEWKIFGKYHKIWKI